MGGKIDLERQPVTGRPFPRDDPPLYIAEDRLVQGLSGRCLCHVRDTFPHGLFLVLAEPISAIKKFGHDLVETIRYFPATDMLTRLHLFFATDPNGIDTDIAYK